MRRMRTWMAPIALIGLTAAACDVKITPPATSNGNPASARTAPDKASPSPADPSRKPSQAPGGSAVLPATPATPRAEPADPPSAGTPVADDRPEAWLDAIPPLLAAPDGHVPAIVAWTRLSPENGIAAYLDIKRTVTNDGLTMVDTSVAYTPDPPDVTITLAAPPGSPGTTIAAYEFVYEYTTINNQKEGKLPVVIGPTRVPIAPLQVPMASNTRAGAPVTIDVAIATRALTDLFRGDRDDLPSMVIARVAFLNEAGMEVANLDLDRVKATVPIRLLAGPKPAATAAPTGPPPAPPSLAPVTAGPEGPTPMVLAWAGLAPATGIAVRLTQARHTETNGAVFVETTVAYDPTPADATVYLTAPPGSPGNLVAAYELSFTYTTPAAQQAGRAPTVVGPLLVPIPPRQVRTGATTAFHIPLASIALDAIFAEGYPDDAPTLVTADVGFQDLNGVPIADAKLQPLKATIPIHAL